MISGRKAGTQELDQDDYGKRGREKIRCSLLLLAGIRK
jgi:hypothetical protein